MADSARILEYLVIVTAFEGLVSKKVDFFKAFWLDMSKCICFIPSRREDIEGDLATNGIGEAIR